MLEYSSLNEILVKSNETEIFGLTGCLSTCEKYEFMSGPKLELLKTPSEEEQLQIGFVFKSGSHERKEQVWARLKFCLVWRGAIHL